MKKTVMAAAVALAFGVAAPAWAGPVATNDAEYASLGRVFPEIEDSTTYTLFTTEFQPAIRYLDPSGATETIVIQVYQTAFRFHNFPYASTLGVAGFVMAFTVALVFLAIQRRQEMELS